MSAELAGGTEEPDTRSDLDGVLAEIWREETGREPVSIHQTLAALGGTRVGADRIHRRVCREIQVDLPRNAVHASSTVAGLADIVAQIRYKARRHPTMVMLQSGDGRSPLFCVSGGGGYAFNFLSLARRLGPEQRVYGFHARGLDGRGRPDWTVQAHARRTLESIRAVQHDGPYHLLGFSFGGLVALEVAQRLLATGQQVAHLAMVDTPLPSPAPSGSDRRRGMVTQLKVGTRAALGRTSGPLGVVKCALLPLTGLVRFPGRHHAEMFWLVARTMVDLYQASPYPGASTIYLAESGSHASGPAWAEVLGGEIRQVVVPGGHETMLRGPNVASLATDLAARLHGLPGVTVMRAPGGAPDTERQPA